MGGRDSFDGQACCIKQCDEVCRRALLKVQGLTGCRLDQPKALGVQRLPINGWLGLARRTQVIDGIAHNGITNGLQMHSNLVGPARLKPAGKQPNGLSLEKPRGKHLVMGRCGFAALSIDNGHALSVAGVPAHWRLNLTPHKPGSARGTHGLSMPADGQIMPKDRLTLQLPDQAGLAGQRLGNHHKT